MRICSNYMSARFVLPTHPTPPQRILHRRLPLARNLNHTYHTYHTLAVVPTSGAPARSVADPTSWDSCSRDSRRDNSTGPMLPLLSLSLPLPVSLLSSAEAAEEFFFRRRFLLLLLASESASEGPCPWRRWWLAREARTLHLTRAPFLNLPMLCMSHMLCMSMSMCMRMSMLSESIE